MRFPELLHVLQRPLLIKPSAHASYLKLFEDHLSQSRAEFNAERVGTDWCGKAIEIDQAETVNGICYIPIGGPLGRGLGAFEKGAGCVDYQDIADELDAFEEDSMARAAILVFDTPGGMCQGLTACRDRLLACDKPVHSYSAGMICSAGYALAVATDGIWATSDADIGSIGVYCYTIEASKRYADAGYKPILITSGIHKGAGAPGMPYTKAQLELLQTEVDDLADEFYLQVEEARGADNVSREDMQGQSFRGKVALQKGLIDGVVGSLEEVAALL
jgi:ClpP class serine protease